MQTGLSLLSRGLGFLRSLGMAALLGASGAADAFWAAFKLVNFFRLFLGEGALGAAMLPELKEIEAKHEDQPEVGAQKAHEFTAKVLRLGLLACVGFLLLGALVYRRGIELYLPGMDSAGQDLTAQLTATMAPYLLCIGFVSILIPPLQGARKILPVACHPIAFNVALLVGIFFAPSFSNPVEALALSVLVGGVAQAAIMGRAALRLGIPWHRPGPLGLEDPSVRQVGKAMAPTVLGTALMRLTTLVDGAFASMVGVGAFSHLQYANLLFNAALGVAGTSIASVYFTPLSEAAAAKDPERTKEVLAEAFPLVFLVTIPGVVLALVYPESLAQIFVRRNFTVADLAPTAAAIRGYFLGLGFAASLQLLTRTHYAAKRHGFVVRVGILSSLLNILLDWLWAKPFGVGGLALATTSAFGLHSLVLGLQLGPTLPKNRILASLARVGVAAGFAAGVVSLLPTRHPLILVPAFGAVYLVSLRFANTLESKLIGKMLGRFSRKA